MFKVSTSDHSHGNHISFTSHNGVDDVPDGVGLDMWVQEYEGAPQGFFLINISWIQLMFRVGAGNQVYVRVQYGGNGWSHWTQIN